MTLQRRSLVPSDRLGLQPLVISGWASETTVPAALPPAVGQHGLVVDGHGVDMHSPRGKIE